ncbi:MAG: tripartite tricarboxylate transporter permease, partial [Stackebrandtia sp.]
DEEFRVAVDGEGGDLSVFWTRPLTLSLLILTAVSLVLPYVPRMIAKAKGRKAGKLAVGDTD